MAWSGESCGCRTVWELNFGENLPSSQMILAVLVALVSTPLINSVGRLAELRACFSLGTPVLQFYVCHCFHCLFLICPKSCLSSGCWIKFQVQSGKRTGQRLLGGEIQPQISVQAPAQLDTNHKDHQIKYLPPQKFHISPPRGILSRGFMCAVQPVNIRKLPREVPRRLSQMPLNK